MYEMPTNPEGSTPGPKRVGRTPKPLTILVHPGLMEWAEVEALQEQGHRVTRMDGDVGDSWDYDMILAPNAWRMTEDLRPYLELAIKSARKAKYGKDKEGAE